MGVEASGLQEDARDLGGGGHQGGEGQRQVHYSRPLHVEDQEEAGDQGWQAGGLRKGGDGEGQARLHRGQGILRVCPEEGNLRGYWFWPSLPLLQSRSFEAGLRRATQVGMHVEFPQACSVGSPWVGYCFPAVYLIDAVPGQK